MDFSFFIQFRLFVSLVIRANAKSIITASKDLDYIKVVNSYLFEDIMVIGYISDLSQMILRMLNYSINF